MMGTQAEAVRLFYVFASTIMRRGTSSCESASVAPQEKEITTSCRADRRRNPVPNKHATLRRRTKPTNPSRCPPAGRRRSSTTPPRPRRNCLSSRRLQGRSRVFRRRRQRRATVPSGAPTAQERPADGLRVKPTANLNSRPSAFGPYRSGVVYQSNGNAVSNNFGGGMKVELPF